MLSLICFSLNLVYCKLSFSFHFQAINEIHDQGEKLFKLLIASLCPSIYGHEIVKAGLILGLFGGKVWYLFMF